MARPQKNSNYRLLIITQALREENKGEWPSVATIREHGQCSMERAAKALEFAKRLTANNRLYALGFLFGLTPGEVDERLEELKNTHSYARRPKAELQAIMVLKEGVDPTGLKREEILERTPLWDGAQYQRLLFRYGLQKE